MAEASTSWAARVQGILPHPVQRLFGFRAETSSVHLGEMHSLDRFPQLSGLQLCDFNKIRPYAHGLHELVPHRAPFLAQFARGTKKLAYIAAQHQNGPENETFTEVREAIASTKPQLIILEGFETVRGVSPDFMKEHAAKAAADNFTKVAEPTYTAYLATEQNIPFVGGEPSIQQAFGHMHALGYSDKDMMAFYLLRFIPIWREQGAITSETFDEYAQRYLDGSREFAHIPTHERLTLNEFKEWHAKHTTKTHGHYKIGTQEMAPLQTPDATYFNRMSADLTIVREQHLDRTIAQALEENDRVLVVYGSGHYLQSEPVFEQMFGSKAQYSKISEKQKSAGGATFAATITEARQAPNKLALG